MPSSCDLDTLIQTLQQRAKAGSSDLVPRDLQNEALAQFRRQPRFDTLRAARFVAFGLGVPNGTAGTCILDCAAWLDAVLDGIEPWIAQPHAYRRCYQGLLWSYFRFDPEADASTAAHANWLRLREYLLRNAARVASAPTTPRWADAVLLNLEIFGERPATRYAESMLRGELTEVNALCDALGIDGDSWFVRELVDAQIVAATELSDDAFLTWLPSLLEKLAGTSALRHRGLAMLLQRHVAMAGETLTGCLRDAALQWWGTPWATSTALNWARVDDTTRIAVGDSMKAYLIDAFFQLESGGSRRRADFWKRYIAAMRRVEIAFGPSGKAGGLTNLQSRGVRLQSAESKCDGAMVLEIGSALIVVFRAPDAPAFGYDLRKGVPFDLDRPLAFARDADNSLRLSRRDLELPHRDGQGGWRQWEQMFEAALNDRFDVRVGASAGRLATSFVDLSDDESLREDHPSGPLVDPIDWVDESVGEDVHWQTAEAASVPYSRPDLEVLARVHALRIEDLTARGGKLWVRSEVRDPRLEGVLVRWGFGLVAGLGWCKQ